MNEKEKKIFYTQNPSFIKNVKLKKIYRVFQFETTILSNSGSIDETHTVLNVWPHVHIDTTQFEYKGGDKFGFSMETP